MNRKAAVLRRSDGEEVGPASHGPGPRLRDGRLARSMTLEEAAELLKLDPTVLASLERDDFTALPGQIYVRGYLASYARLLGIPEQEVVRDYLAYTGDASTPILSTRRPIEGQSSSSDMGLRWFSYGLMIGIVCLVAWWGYQRLPSDAPNIPVAASSEESSQSAETPPLHAPASQTAELESLPSIDEIPQAVAAEPASAQVEVAAYTALPEGGEPLAASSPENPENGQESALEEETPSVEPAAPGSEALAPIVAVVGETASEPAQPESIASTESDAVSSGNGERSPDILRLSFGRDCWIEVHDARQQRLAYGLAKAGSSRQVEGEAPFQILLGDSGAVEIQLNGKATPRSSYDVGEGRPARLSLGGEQLETASAP